MTLQRVVIACVLFLGALSACQTTSTGPILVPNSPTAPSTPSPDDQAAILALMAAEAEAVIHDDSSGLLEIWTADGLIRDANHTPNDPTDDYTWAGHDAILSRYLTIVFPLYISQLERAEVQLTIGAVTATASATTLIEGEISPGGEVWTFSRIDGAWRIAGIVFNLEAP